jgi:hypothetical protein
MDPDGSGQKQAGQLVSKMGDKRTRTVGQQAEQDALNSCTNAETLLGILCGL